MGAGGPGAEKKATGWRLAVGWAGPPSRGDGGGVRLKERPSPTGPRLRVPRAAMQTLLAPSLSDHSGAGGPPRPVGDGEGPADEEEGVDGQDGGHAGVDLGGVLPQGRDAGDGDQPVRRRPQVPAPGAAPRRGGGSGSWA